MVALVILTISLALIGSLLINSSKDVQFPPNISKCPDGYTMAYDFNTDSTSCINTSSEITSDCQQEDFGDASYNMPGIGLTSGACAKKKWAQNCNVDWDGLTNNSLICHTTNL